MAQLFQKLRLLLDKNKEQVLALVGSLEQHSPHVVAKALVSAAKEQGLSFSPAEDTSEQAGHGITGFVSGKKVSVGQQKLAST